MKKSFIVFVALVMICLSSCKASGIDPTSPDIIGTTDFGTGEATTAIATEQTVPPEETTVPVESSTAPVLLDILDPGARTWLPQNLVLVQFGGREYSYGIPEYVEVSCKMDCLYIYDKYYQDLKQFGDGPVVLGEACEDNVIYVLESEPQKVYRADVKGENHTVIYEATYGNIDAWQYFDKAGIGGKLAVLEGNTHILLVDLASGETETLLVHEDMYQIDLSLLWNDKIGFRKISDNSFWYINIETGELYETPF